MARSSEEPSLSVKGLSTAWTKHLTGTAKSDLETIVRNSTRVLTRLKEIIEEREQEIQHTSYSIKDFQDPNWSHKQAFKNGELAVLAEFKKLIPL